MTTTPRDIINQARIRHWSFIDVQLADGAAVLWMNQRQRHVLLLSREALHGLLGTTIETAAVVSGALVGVTAGGTPYYLTTIDDGYAVSVTAGGTPYLDTTLPPIAKDPFGESGGAPGWPLPVDAIALLTMTAQFDSGLELPVSIMDESERLTTQAKRALPAFLSANRVVPIRPPSTMSTGDRWASVVSVRLSYVGITSVTTLDSAITLPAPLLEALIAGLAELFANQSKDCATAERARFAEAARRAEQDIAAGALDLLGTMQLSHVIVRR